MDVLDEQNVEFNLNPDRLAYILDLYGLSQEDLIFKLNEERKRDLISKEKLERIISGKEKIDIKLLKRIDKIFKQGITWYLTNRELPERKNCSIFFRKDKFNTDLNFESRRIVNNFEELKFEIQILCKSIQFDPKRIVKKYQISDDSLIIAKEMNAQFKVFEEELIDKNEIKKPKDDKEYLKNLVRIIEDFNIFVFEFTENWNKKEKAMFNGFYISPNIIVIKRQKYLRREIFTLIHEFAHYLLDFEEIDDVEESNVINSNECENWCNTFSYYFLIDEYKKDFDKLIFASETNQFYKDEINELYDHTRLSKSAFYTRMIIEDKISRKDYNKIINEIRLNVRKREAEEKILRETEKQLAKDQGKPFVAIQKPIQSNLFKEILTMNYFQGNVDESTLRKHLKISANKSIDEVIY